MLYFQSLAAQICVLHVTLQTCPLQGSHWSRSSRGSDPSAFSSVVRFIRENLVLSIPLSVVLGKNRGKRKFWAARYLVKREFLTGASESWSESWARYLPLYEPCLRRLLSSHSRQGSRRSWLGSAALFFFLPPTLCPLSGSNLAGRSAHKTDWNLISLADVDSEGSLDRMQLVISRSVS